MERLNDIILKAAQRRQQMLEQQSPESTAPIAPQSQGQRQGQALSRRPAPQQLARRGQQAPHAGQSSNQYHPRSQRSQPGQYGQYSRVPRTRSPQGEPMGPMEPTPQRDGYTRQYSQPAGPLYQQRPGPVQEPQTRLTADYYQPDSYSSMVQADVVEDWEGDADEAEDMRYGDWENEEGDMETYPRSHGGRFSPADAAPARREMPVVPSSPILPVVSSQDQRLPASRPPRNTRVSPAQQTALPLPQMPQAPQVPQLPQPSPSSQESRNYHRVTQPLNSRAVARVSQQMVQESPQAQKSARQLVLSEQQSISYLPGLPLPSSAQRGVCPKCKGAGFLRADVPYWDPNFGKPVPCECKEAERKEKRRQQLLELANLDAFRDKTFDNFDHRIFGVQKAYQAALDYARDPNGWLLLIGRNGSGKTHLAAAIANKHLVRGSLVLFATVPDLLDHLRATFAPTSTVVYDQLFSTMREAELLVLDDLGSQQSSSWANEKLFQLLNYRYNSRFPTVITTNNIGLQGIDERLRSRLMDTGLVITETFDGAKDYRLRNPRRE